MGGEERMKGGGSGEGGKVIPYQSLLSLMFDGANLQICLYINTYIRTYIRLIHYAANYMIMNMHHVFEIR